MNIAFVLERFGTGGTGGYAARLARDLVRRGRRVTVFAVDALAVDGVEVRPLRVAARRGLPGMLALLWASQAIPRGEFDVVQGFGRTLGHDVFRAGGGSHAAWLESRDRLVGKQLAAIRSPVDRLERAIDRRAVLSARMVVCNSEMAAADLRRGYGLAAARCRVIRNGVDLERFAPNAASRAETRARIGAEGRVALFIGHGFRRKGLAVAADAFARVAGPRDRLVVVGRDAHAERFLAPIRRVLGDRLTVVGSVADPAPWYAAADAVILPTHYDAAANTTVEAMACGVPAITSGRDGNAEIAPPSLVVADPADADGFAAALRTAWEDADLRRVVRAIAEEWPDSRNGDAMDALYRELCDGA